MTPNELIEGLRLAKTSLDSDDIHCERDQIWIIGEDAETLGEQATAQLEALGWFWDEESWSHYT